MSWQIGIVGRTGAGKSSILQVLFRLVELSKGSILVDGQDVSALGLDFLRHHLSAIPQDPLVFAGTVRENLNPEGGKSDAELNDALHKCGLMAAEDAAEHEINRLEKFKLDGTVDAGGDNYSYVLLNICGTKFRDEAQKRNPLNLSTIP